MTMLENQPADFRLSRNIYLGIFLLSAAVLLYEINLTRIFSVAQFYHFAFLIVSIAMLGSGAGGTFLALLPPHHRLLQAESGPKYLPVFSLAAGVGMIAAYLLVNELPFDSFRVTQKPVQWLVLALHYAALALPFFFSGMAMGMLLSIAPQRAGAIYSNNLLGSAMGCLAALFLPGMLGAEGIVVICSLMAVIAAMIFIDPISTRKATPFRWKAIPLEKWWRLITCLVCALLLLPDLGMRIVEKRGYAFLQLKLSPYKSLSYALQAPGSEILSQEWNAFSRIDVVRSPAIHSLPGLSYRYLDPLPSEDGLLVDGDELNPLLEPMSQWKSSKFAQYLPSALAFQLRPEADTLVLDARGGVEVLAALSLGANEVVAVEVNPLIIAAAPQVYAPAGEHKNRVKTVIEYGRSYLRENSISASKKEGDSRSETFDIIILPLISSYHPVRSGAYSLAEDYRYTVEAFTDALERLNPGGLLVVSRWLQNPPSESLKAFALAVTALDQAGADPSQQIMALRSYNIVTLLVSNRPFEPGELQAVRDFARTRAFDLVYLPGIKTEEINQYNVLDEPVYEQAFARLLASQPRQVFYEDYPYDVRPPTDDHPFFSHFFKWSQAGEVLADLGKTWQPFGGAGFFVIIALLVLACIFAAILVLLPGLGLLRRKHRENVAIPKIVGRVSTPATYAGRDRNLSYILRNFLMHFYSFPSPRISASSRRMLPMLLYFGLIGLAYLLVEIPLIQQFILYLGNPAYAVTIVLFSLLLFSGIGSRLSGRISLSQVDKSVGQAVSLPNAVFFLLLLVVLLLGLPSFFPILVNQTLGLALGWRMVITSLMLAPAGLLMGIPFPMGIRQLNAMDTETGSPWIGWSWAINGAASVIAAVLASMLALSFGFRFVFWTGAAAYALSLLALVTAQRLTATQSPRR